MQVSIVTPNFNGARFLEESLRSVQAQRDAGVEVEHIVIAGGSTDGSLAILERHRAAISHLVSEPDHGPASAIKQEKGMRTK